MSENLAAQAPVRRFAEGDSSDVTAEPPPEPSLEPVDYPPTTTLVGEVFLPCDEQASGQARRILSATLDVWGLSHLFETASTVLAELVSNAVRHAGGRQIGLTLWRRLTLVHISVRDCSRALPCLIMTGPFPTTAESGRGLQLVAALTFRWGTELLPGGKRVWAEIAV
ncbi:MAG: ATP-binding protein [Streptomyces oryziradicis]|jgi:hypothetical protein|nr:ATP-binding protein [Actinacidiphila oryziradicis]